MANKVWLGTWSNRIGTTSAVIPKARAVATMAAPIIEPNAIPPTPSEAATAPTARFIDEHDACRGSDNTDHLGEGNLSVGKVMEG
jgi:hypothetical protein